MSNIILPDYRSNNKINSKDCPDFIPMKDGTITGDPKYCWLSFICKEECMRTDYTFYTGPALKIENGHIKETWYDNIFEYFCTGHYATVEDKGIDEEIS